jgi:hypothetical protein
MADSAAMSNKCNSMNITPSTGLDGEKKDGYVATQQ